MPILAVHTAQLGVAQREDLLSLNTSFESKTNLIANSSWKKLKLKYRIHWKILRRSLIRYFRLPRGSERQIIMWRTSVNPGMQCKDRDEIHAKDWNFQNYKFQSSRDNTYSGINSGICSLHQCTATQSYQMVRDCSILKHLWRGAKVKSHLVIPNANNTGPRNALQARYNNLRLIVWRNISAMLDVSFISLALKISISPNLKILCT